MKRYLYIAIIFIPLFTAVGSCEKNTYKITDRSNPLGQGRVKIGLFNAYTQTSPVRVSINDVFVSNELVHPTAYPGGGLNVLGSLNSDYLQVAPGASKYTFYAMNQGTPVPAYKMFETTQTVEPNKRYTLFLTDTAQNTAAILVSDETTIPDSGLVRIKFIDIMPNVPALDLYKGINASSAALVVGNIPYKTNSEYINIAAGTDSFFVRPAGSPVSAVPVARNRFALTNQRIYTILSRGYNGATGNRAANISAIINQ